MAESDGLTAQIAGWSAATVSEALPTAVADFAQRALLDFFKASIVGSATPWAKAALEAVRAARGSGPARVMVVGDFQPLCDAALIHGAFAHACDIDDSHVGGMVHPGAAVLPAAFAAAALSQADGQTLRAALVAGYEVTVRLALAIQPAHFRQGFQATGTCGALGAAAAAARVLRLDPVATAHAIGIAASRAGGLAQFYYSGSSVKRLHAGFAASAGLGAALLARQGLTAPRDALEGRAGFGVAYGQGLDVDRLLGGLGETYAMLDTTMKVHATSARLQAYVEATVHAVREAGLPTADIVGIEAPVPAILAGRLTQSDPPDITAAQMSLPFTVALTAVRAASERGPIVLSGTDYATRLDDPEVRRVARLTRCPTQPAAVDYNPDAESVPGHVRLRYRSGHTVERSVRQAEGTPGRPLSVAALDAVLLQTAAPIVGPGACRRLSAAVADLEGQAATAVLDLALAAGPDGRRGPAPPAE